MKKAILLSVLMVLMVVPQVVLGDTVVVNRIAGYTSGGGGEFTLTPDVWQGLLSPLYVQGVTKNVNVKSPPPLPNFQSFCMETTEFVSLGSTYNVVFNDRAIMGQNPPNGDPISIGTAYLYSQFVKGTLRGYNYTAGAGRDTSAEALQKTIWWLEGEGLDPGAGNIFRQAVITKYGSAANAMADNNWAYGVEVLNLYNKDGSLAQDMLVAVPEPATMLFLGGGLLGMAGFLRKKFKK